MMGEIINKKCVLIVSIFRALDNINPDWDAKEVWQNLKNKELHEIEAIYKSIVEELIK